MRGFIKTIGSIGLFLLKIATYCAFMAVYLGLVLHFLDRFLKHAFDDNRALYAAISLGLIAAQAFLLEMLTSTLWETIQRRNKR